MIGKKQLSKIGIGTWGYGGLDKADPNNDDEKQIEAIVYSLNKGLNFVEICNWYAEGKAVELFKKALDSWEKRIDDIFLSISLYQHRNPTLSDVQNEFEYLQKMFGVTCFDNVVVTFSGLKVWGQRETFNYLDLLLKNNNTRYVSITNSNLEMIKIFKNTFGDRMFGHELTYSFEIRENGDAGIIDYCNKNNIKNVVWQPLRRNKTALRNWELLVELAKKYSKTQNQIILGWLVAKGFLPLVKSEDPRHIDENINSVSFKLETSDIKKLNNFRPPNWKTPKIDWNKTGDGVSVSQLPTIFDEEYGKQI